MHGRVIGLGMVLVVCFAAASCGGGSKTRYRNPKLQIVTTSLPPGQVGVSYLGLVEYTGGNPPVTWSVASGSSLPSGLVLDPTGIMTGIPSQTGNFAFDLRATDSAGDFEVGTITMDVTAGSALSIASTSPLPSGNVAIPYSFVITTSGGFGTKSFSVSAGGLPAGLSIDAATGEIFGVPQVAGPYSFDITVIDSQTPTPNTASKNFDLVIDPGVPADHLLVNEINTSGGFTEVLNPTATDQDMTGWSLEVYWYGFLIGRYFFPSFTLPAGEVVGIYQGSGTDSLVPPLFLVYSGWSFNMVSRDEHEIILFDDTGAGVDYLAINDVGTATHCPPNLNWSGVFNQWYHLSSGTLGVDVIRTSFVDTDNASDLFAIDDSGTNGDLNPGQAPDSILLTSVVLWDGFEGMPYYQKLAATGGLPPYAFSAPNPAALPPGLVVDPVQGAITGVPTTVGTYTFAVDVEDSYSPPATNTANVTINILATTAGSPMDIKVNELDYGDPDRIEIMNKGTGAVDISGWHLQVMYELPAGTAHIIHVTFPQGTVLPGGQILETGEGLGGFPSQYEMGWGFYAPPTGVAPAAAAIVDETFWHIDYVEYNSTGLLPQPLGVSWTGGGLVCTGNECVSRSMSAPDTDGDADWCVIGAGLGTPGAPNTNCP